jgi:hypothetical protein
LNTGTPFLCEYCPVRSVARLGEQIELVTNELTNFAPPAARRSMWGVRFTFEP